MPKTLLLIACLGYLAGCDAEREHAAASGSGGTVGTGLGGASEVGGAVDSAGTTDAGNNVGGSGPAMSGTSGEGTIVSAGTLAATGGATPGSGGATPGSGGATPGSGGADFGGAAAIGGSIATGGAEADGAAAPQNLTVPPLAFEDTHLTVVWDKPLTGKASGYNIYADGKKVGSVSKVVYPSGDSNQQLFFDIPGLSPSTLYTITARTLDASGAESTDSNSVVQATTATPVTVDVTSAPYSAPSNGSTIATAAIQKAIDDCPSGGRILFPAGGKFLSGSLYLKGECTYQVDGVLIASGNTADYQKGNNRFPVYGTGGKFGGIRYPDNYKALINTCGGASSPDKACTSVRDIRLTGKGTIQGNSNLASAEGGGDNRGDLVSLTGVRGIYIANLTFSRSSEHMLFVAGSSNITITNINDQSPGISNGDGIDLVTAYSDQLTQTGPVGLLPTNAYIFGSTWNNGDDCINLNSGTGAPGVAAGTPLDGVHIFNNDTLAGHGGVVYGSFTAAGLKNVRAVENTFNGTDIGFRFKTGSGHGGGMATIGPSDVGFVGSDNIGKTAVCLEVTNQYPDTTGLPGAGIGVFHDITLSNYQCSAVLNIDSGYNIVVNGKTLR